MPIELKHPTNPDYLPDYLRLVSRFSGSQSQTLEHLRRSANNFGIRPGQMHDLVTVSRSYQLVPFNYETRYIRANAQVSLKGHRIPTFGTLAFFGTNELFNSTQKGEQTTIGELSEDIQNLVNYIRQHISANKQLLVEFPDLLDSLLDPQPARSPNTQVNKQHAPFHPDLFLIRHGVLEPAPIEYTPSTYAHDTGPTVEEIRAGVLERYAGVSDVDWSQIDLQKPPELS